jgi:hypothetical protein
MRTLITLWALLALRLGQAQVVLENTYPDAGFSNGQLFLWEFEVSGLKWVKIDRAAFEVTLYNLDHTEYTSFSFAQAPTTNGVPTFLYLSEHLFDLDDGIEFIYTTGDGTANNQHLLIYNDDGSVVWDGGNRNIFVFPTWHMQQYPIQNSDIGTARLVVGTVDGDAEVYALPGRLWSCCELSTGMAPGPSSQGASIFPDPTDGFFTVQCDGTTRALLQQVEVVDAAGAVVLQQSAGSAQGDLRLDLTGFADGVYNVMLVTSQGRLYGGRIVLADR